jgi:nicotinate-nucleotide adenylyltransferase
MTRKGDSSFQFLNYNIESGSKKTSPFFGNGSTLNVGIFGGTFNPPHVGHLRLAEEVAERHGLSKVVFVPSLIPPHKSRTDLAEPHHRMAMTRRACGDNSVFEVSDLELSQPGPSFTVKTLETLQRNRPLPLHFIMGTDSLRDICTWKDYPRLFELSHFIVVQRPGVDFSTAWRSVPDEVRRRFRCDGAEMVHESATRVIPSPVQGLDISATRIRNLVKTDRSIRYLVPESVRAYIAENKLYQDDV